MIYLPQTFERIIDEIPHRVPRLKHVDPSRILVLVQKMGASKQGQNAGLRHARQGRVFAPVFPNVTYHGRDIRYAISFHPGICTDFFQKDCSDPMEVVMHELWHIGSKCDGKLRRMRHGKQFNQIVSELTDTYYKNGGRPMEKLNEREAIVTRYWKNRQQPSIAYIRRGMMEHFAREMAKINWQQNWDESHVMEKRHRLSSLIPKLYKYICPNGHESTSSRRYRTPRSCSICSPRFSERYLLRRI